MIAIRAANLSKKFDIYSKPSHRALEFFSLGRKKYGAEFWALKDLAFSIKKGEAIGLLGANGSGKSTLMKLIAGITYPSEGTIESQGRVSALIELGMGFHPEFSGRANVYLNASLMGIARREIDEKFESILDFSGLRDFIDYPIKTYSSGMQVRLAFSIAISVDPDILLIDEALAVGDALFQRRCLKKIQEFHDRGVTIFFVSHDMVTLKVLCRQAILVDHGRLLAMGETGDVIDRYAELVAQREAKYVKSLKAPATWRGGGGSLTENLKTGRRYGSSEARILSVKLFDRDGQERSAFVCGDAVNIQVTALALEPVESLTVGIMIRTPHGLEVFGTNTYNQNIFLENCREGEAMTVSFTQDVRLAPGNYFITAALHSGDTHKATCYDWWNDAALLKITPGTAVFSGVTDFGSEVAVGRNFMEPPVFRKVLAAEVFPGAPSAVCMNQDNRAGFFLSGWYDTEEWQGEIVRRTSRESTTLLKGEATFSRIHIRACAGGADLSRGPLTGTVTVNGDACGTFAIEDADWLEISLPLARRVDGIAKIKITVDTTWNPKATRQSSDDRELGIAVESIKFL
ncbi:MAG: ABC transporter ATP-binding protein [Nitrospinales bacterium]